MDFFQWKKEYDANILAITQTGEQITYQEAEEFSREFGTYMPRRALVFLLCDNSLGSLLGYLSCLKNNRVPLLLEKHIHKGFLDQLIAEYHPAYIYAPQENADLDGYGTKIFSKWDYILRKIQEQEDTIIHKDLALLLTTSGSTGSPKLVRQSRENLTENAVSIAKYLKLTAKERPITTLPMNYTYGLSIMNSHILVGATLLLTRSGIMEREFWEFGKKEGATSFGGVPYTYEILKRIGFLTMDLPKLQTLTQAGGKLSLALHSEFANYAKEKNKQFIVMYGQTEATARMGYLPWELAVEKCGSMGIAIPGGQFSLIDEEGEEIQQWDTVGELVYKGKNVTMGYALNREDLSKGDEWQGILYTGDMAKRDKDGFYYITGRKKRFLKLYGKRINLDEVERLLKETYPQADFACVGQDDQMVIYTDQKQLAESKAVIDDLARVTNINTHGFTVHFIEQIPKNEAGKTIYSSIS
ncbi:MAG: AMP-binding protein [Lachnospiraceae bacterium]